MTIVGRRPVQTVTNDPYISVHCLNLYHGLRDGKSHLLPTKGTGEGPGGLEFCPHNVRKKELGRQEQKAYLKGLLHTYPRVDGSPSLSHT